MQEEILEKKCDGPQGKTFLYSLGFCFVLSNGQIKCSDLLMYYKSWHVL